MNSSNYNVGYFPSDILCKIFSYVNEEDVCNSIPFVCEKWKIASSHSVLENANFKGNLISSKDICNLLHNAPLLKSVTLDSVDDVVPVLRQLCRCNKQIERVTMKNCSSNGSVLPEESLINVLLSFSDLQSIGLRHTKFKSHLFYEMLARQSNVTSIDVSLNEYVTVKDLMIMVHNIKIQEFKMSRRYKLPAISDREMAHLIKTMKPHLTLLHLDMSGLGSYSYNEIFCCFNLTDLKLNNAMNLSAELLSKLPYALRKTHHLKIEGPSLLTQGDLYKNLFENSNLANQLESLKLENFDSLYDNECYKTLELCSNLMVLSLKGCRSVTIDGILKPLLRLCNLTYLNVAYLGKSSGIRNVERLPHLCVLVVDCSSYEQNNLIKFSQMNNEFKIIQLSKGDKNVS